MLRLLVIPKMQKIEDGYTICRADFFQIKGDKCYLVAHKLRLHEYLMVKIALKQGDSQTAAPSLLVILPGTISVT